MSGPDRRRFLSQFLGGAAVAAVTPVWAGASPTERVRPFNPGGYEPQDEAFWERVKDQFSIAPGLILMNAANLCPSPYPVQESVFRHTRDVNQDASFQNRGKFGALKEEARVALAAYVGRPADGDRYHQEYLGRE